MGALIRGGAYSRGRLVEDSVCFIDLNLVNKLEKNMQSEARQIYLG